MKLLFISSVLAAIAASSSIATAYDVNVSIVPVPTITIIYNMCIVDSLHLLLMYCSTLYTFSLHYIINTNAYCLTLSISGLSYLLLYPPIVIS